MSKPLTEVAEKTEGDKNRGPSFHVISSLLTKLLIAQGVGMFAASARRHW